LNKKLSFWIILAYSGPFDREKDGWLSPFIAVKNLSIFEVFYMKPHKSHWQHIPLQRHYSKD